MSQDRAGPAVRILTVCSHNRTRSVMMAAMLESMIGTRIGADGVLVRSGGFGPAGLPAIDEAVSAMRRRGLDVSAHRSTSTTAELVGGADVILTAERDHVIRVAALSSAAFRRAMTLPEFLVLAASAPIGDGADVGSWVERLTAGRTAMAYLHGDIGEIDDPTGWSRRAFEGAVVALEQQCRQAAELLVRATSRT